MMMFEAWLGSRVMMIDLCEQGGRTAALWASQEGHEGALGLLIAAGADLNVQDKVNGDVDW